MRRRRRKRAVRWRSLRVKRAKRRRKRSKSNRAFERELWSVLQDALTGQDRLSLSVSYLNLEAVQGRVQQ